ncbi:NAD-dependent epimerase/dehydratase family protein [Paractinoplanes lichenicola]|uniref:NAD-dependent epimerase/dehydratase family protein n=1 Tax=Paractinoplanes lichenicola TaxID=2802976 RepID=A0ABS1W047_9ACTN|nr:NAD-dependent epimerase/dehydratase family protein [Actinoplanes lichenicola]MBL7260108.1 NAD-dependent epimerase/dehydratase family protein [Actinoplanes lichenicola]
MSESVLVTGGSGFVAGYVVRELLGRGYRVRATLRSLRRADAVRGKVGVDGDLSFVAADLLSDDGWDAATEGMTYVVHTASPMPVGEHRGQDITTPARHGTRRVLQAARRAGVRRVVVTSSTAAAMPAVPGAPADERTWTDLPDQRRYAYPRAKTLAERDAWRLIREWPDGPELTTVLPANIQGPALDEDLSPSVGLIRLMLSGKMPVLPRMGYPIVDVRDLAVLHAEAMTAPAAAGQRFIAAGEFLWFREIAAILRDRLGPAAAKVSLRQLPNWVVRAAAPFNAEMDQLAPSLGVRSNLSSAHAEKLLGWRTRPAAESVTDTAHSLLELGLV